MILFKIFAVVLLAVLGSIILGCASLGACYFIDSLREYQQEAKYFNDEK